MSRLILCAGRQKRDGWLTLDANPRCGPDILATVPPLPEAVAARRWDEIELVHGIEHFYPWDAERLLRECHGVLATGGRLVLEQPDVGYAARVLCGRITPPADHPRFGLWALYGDPGGRDPLMGHRWGYTPESLLELLVRCGFDRGRIEVSKARTHFPVRDFRVEALRE